jgi:drug/metabolite transporter (DMT)-like permease
MSKREALEVSEAGLIEPVPVPVPVLPDGRPLIGVLMVMASVLLFAGNDIVTKLLVTEYPVPLVAATRYIVQLLLMMALLLPRMGTRLLKTERTGLVLLRSACLVVSTLGMGLAFQRMPVPESVAIVFLSPMLVVLVAGPVLGEKVAGGIQLGSVKRCSIDEMPVHCSPARPTPTG